MNPVAFNVLAVVVCYYPDQHRFNNLVTKLAPQVRRLLIVDNTPKHHETVSQIASEASRIFPNIEIQSLGDNFGIAFGFNKGIAEALSSDFEYVLLSDQDSDPPIDLVSVLTNICTQIQQTNTKVGSICPEYFDKNTNRAIPFPVQLPGRALYSNIHADLDRPWLEIITSISSGTLITRQALEEVGGMREEFFIDHVDTEWSHRARRAGFHHFGTRQTRIVHHLGDGSFEFWLFGWQTLNRYSPIRLYYRFRNFVALVKLPYVPKLWAVRASWYWLGNIYAHTLFSQRRLENLKMILIGLFDGLRGKVGKYSGQDSIGPF